MMGRFFPSPTANWIIFWINYSTCLHAELVSVASHTCDPLISIAHEGKD